MNRKLILMSAVALIFGRPSAFCTANGDTPAAPPGVDDIIARVSALEAASAEKDSKIADLEKQLAAARAEPKPAPDSMLALVAKGAGMDLKDLTWRVANGLTPEQAVQAVRAQKNYEAAKAKRAEREKKQAAETAKEEKAKK